MLNALHQDYKRKKGIKEPEPPDCSSSYKEFNDKVEQIQNED